MKMKLLRGYFRAKGLLEDFAKEERGAADIIAIILIIAVVVTLAGIFRKQITEIVESLMDRIKGEKSMYIYPYTAEMRCTDSAPKKRKEWRNERHFAGKVE